MQLSFTRFEHGPTDNDAKRARDAKYRELKKTGVQCSRFVLKNQLRKYSGFGQPDGSIYDAYYIQLPYDYRG